VRDVLGDARDLESAGLGTVDLFLDVGCIQGLDERRRRAEGRGVTAPANPVTLLMTRLPFRGRDLCDVGNRSVTIPGPTECRAG